MSRGSPRVSVGMPVYNGERYLRESIESILAQTYTDFELVISDNGSNDDTERICRDYASADQRIRYYRNDANRGPRWNYHHVFELSTGEYFKWMAHDDRCAPQFLEKCVLALDTDPSAVLCSAKIRIIDERASTIEAYDVERNISHRRPHRRYSRVLASSDHALEQHAVIRSQVLSNTPLIGGFPYSDLALIARLALIGPFIQIPEHLVDYRIHPQQSISRTRFDLMEWWNPTCNGKLSFPEWKLLLEYTKSIREVPLPLTERLWCYFHLLSWPARERNWRRLGKDILVALPQVAAAVVHGSKRQGT